MTEDEAANRARKNATQARWRQRHPEQSKEISRKWREANKEHVLEKERERRPKHKDMYDRARKRWRENNRERYLELARIAYQKRAARLRGAPGNGVTLAEWDSRVSEFGGACAYCGLVGNVAMDHMDPIALGGAHDITNVVPACKSCNSRKRTLTVLEFLTGFRLRETKGRVA